MPIEAILEIRSKRSPELQLFRDSLSALAVDIDPTLSEEELRRALDTKLQAIVKPALNALKTSVRELQVARYRRLLNPEDALVKFAVSSAAGLTVGVPLQLGAIGVLASKLYEFVIGHGASVKQAQIANPWSILFEIKKTAQKHSKKLPKSRRH